MKVCWFGIYDPKYARNRILIDGLRENNIEVIECHSTSKGIKKYIELVKQLRALRGSYDVLYCAFPVHISILFAYLFQSQPIVADAFFSKYDAVVNDRKTYGKYHPKALFFLLVDTLMVRLSKAIVVDTEEHRSYFSRWKSQDSIFVVPVGVHTKEFFVLDPVPQIDTHGATLVQFHGSYIPVQGIDKLVEAANVLRDHSEVTFRFIGKGQEYDHIQALVQKHKLTNITFLPWLSIEELNVCLNQADIILGLFGDADRVQRAIPNKLFQGLAVRKPVITRDTEAVRTVFTDEDILMVSNEPTAIAQAILDLCHNVEKRERLAVNGYDKVMSEYTPKVLGLALGTALQQVLQVTK